MIFGKRIHDTKLQNETENQLIIMQESTGIL